MAGLKNFFVGILTTLLIISLSLAIASLVFSMMINEKTLLSIADNEVKPFIEEQIDTALAETSQSQMENERRTATRLCEQGEVYALDMEAGDPIEIDCTAINNTPPENFKDLLKDSIVDYTINSIKGGLQEASSKLFYIILALWISVALSLILILAIILIEGKFPFKTFGTTGIIAGLPFIFIVFSQTFLIAMVKEEIQKSVPPELIDQVLQSSLFQAITQLLKNLMLGMAIGFALLFLAGLILLLAGVLLHKKNPQEKTPPKKA
ncbi:MAG: hypothetical protein KKD18_04390 [Nanoarchaeota archaeon]|nr:hypothetical protein [Nanoarchaeota archaeon]MBU0977629.1 hypothetical protein [Nanoarchaeota archaeon]